ncbi:MAG: hypothetical protein ACK4KT_07720 [Thermaurantimonas sp.]
MPPDKALQRFRPGVGVLRTRCPLGTSAFGLSTAGCAGMLRMPHALSGLPAERGPQPSTLYTHSRSIPSHRSPYNPPSHTIGP